jgi:hypothetical protein
LPESRLLIRILHGGPRQDYLALLVQGEALKESVYVCIMSALPMRQLLLMLRVKGDGSQHFDCGILLKLTEQVGEEHGTRDRKLLLLSRVQEGLLFFD